MKVVQALGWYFPEKLGGTEIYVQGLCRRLKDAGCSVSVAAPEAGTKAPRTITYDGVEVFRYPIPESPTKAEVQSRSPVRGSDHFHRWLAFKDPDVFHCHTFVTGLGIHEIDAAKAIGAKVVATTHSSSLGWICQRGTLMRFGEKLCDGLALPRRCSACELQHRGMPKPMARWISRTPSFIARAMHGSPGRLATLLGMPAFIEGNIALQRSMLESVDAFVVLTKQAARIVALNGVPPGKLVVNPLGVSHASLIPKPFQPTSPPITVGYLGRFDEIKGVFDLAHAIALLPKETPIRFELRGPIQADADQSVVAKIKSIIGEETRVAINGAVTQDEVPDLLKRWDVACFPPRCLEGGPTAALEAQAAGTPVIGTRIGGLAEFVTDGVNGALVEPTDVRGLADLLVRIANDPAGTIDRWRTAIPEPRTMDQVATDYLDLYRAILRRATQTMNKVELVHGL